MRNSESFFLIFSVFSRILAQVEAYLASSKFKSTLFRCVLSVNFADVQNISKVTEYKYTIQYNILGTSKVKNVKIECY